MSDISSKPVLGVDLGGTKILAAVVTSEGIKLGSAKNPTEAEQGVEHALENLTLTINQALQDAGLGPTDLAGIGMGCPGPLDPDEGIIIAPPNLPGWVNLPLKARLEAAFGVPVFIDNDVNVGTFGEYVYGAAQGADPVVGFFVGTGIGGGIIIGGRIFRGFSKNAGEFGHATLDPKGPRCGCGNKGCLEAFSSRTAINAYLSNAARSGKAASQFAEGERIRSRALAKAYAAGDEAVVKAIDRSSKYLGIAVANAINIIGPEVVVIGGGMLEAFGKVYLERARKYAHRYALPHCIEKARIVAAALEDDAAILCAAALARLELIL